MNSLTCPTIAPGSNETLDLLKDLNLNLEEPDTEAKTRTKALLIRLRELIRNEGVFFPHEILKHWIVEHFHKHKNDTPERHYVLEVIEAIESQAAQ